MVLPATFPDFINQVLSNIVFLGAVSSGALGLIWMLCTYLNVEVGSNWKRLGLAYHAVHRSLCCV
jgi:hypothetical protein